MSEEINSDVTDHDHSNSNVHSFDELDSATSTQSDSDLLKQARKEVKREEKEEPAPSKYETKEVASDKREDEALEETNDKIEEELVEELKLLKAKRGETEYDIPEDAIITVKVDGEETEVSLNDLRANYAGKVPWDKRYTELSQDKRQFNTEKAQVEKYVGDFRELVQANNSVGAMEYLAELSGQDPLEFRRQIREQVISEYQEYLGMSEDQRRTFDVNEENSYLRKKTESDSVRYQQEQANQALNSEISQLQETHSKSDEDLVNAYDKLIEDGYQASEITPNLLNDYFEGASAYGVAERVVQDFDSELLQDDAVMNELTGIILDSPDIEDSELTEILTEAFGTTGKSSKVSKKAASAAKTPGKKEKVSGNRNKLEEFYSFDQLDEPYGGR